MAQKRIAVAMSGGVDSSVTARLLQNEGYHVCGLTMVIARDSSSKKEQKTVKDAQEVARFLGIEHHVIDLRKQFYDSVIKQFIAEYEAGRTPNPCVVCNKFIKFGTLLNKARELGCEKMATGHYVRQKYDKLLKEHQIYKALDSGKDQTYMMYNLNQRTLASTVFPLGSYRKNEIKQLAKDWGLPIANNQESQEICFIDDNDYKKYWQETTNSTGIAGILIDADGRQIGEHQGIQNFTIGQRKGLGVALGYPAYVINIDSQRHIVTIGREELLWSTELKVDNVNWLSGHPPQSKDIEVKIRYRSKPEPAIIKSITGTTAMIVFNKPQRAITPGQSAVFYVGELLLGGGIIG